MIAANTETINRGDELLDDYVDTWTELRDTMRGAGPDDVSLAHSDQSLVRDLAAYERSVCGAMWLWPEEFLVAWKNKAACVPDPGKNLFTFDRTRAFFRAALSLRKKGLSIDPITLAKNFSDAEVAEMGGMVYAMQHIQFCFCLRSSIAHLDAMVKEYRARNAKNILEIAMNSTNDPESLNSTISLVNEQLTKLLTSDSDMITPTEDLVFDTFSRLTTEGADDDRIPTSFRRLADAVGDYRRGQITLVGAPPANGKTAFAMQEIECALMHGFMVDAFLMESSFDQYVERYAMRNAVIHGSKFKTKFFTQDELRKLHDLMELSSKFKNHLHMAKMGSYTSTDIDAMIQSRKAETGLPCDLIVVDHLNRMKHVREKGQSEYEAQKDTLQHLSTIAARENAVLLLMDQLTVEAVRNSFGKGSRFPGIGAFRGGVVTEYAKVVIILHKDEQEMLKANQPVVEQHIVICKANDGASGAIQSLFLKPFAMHIEDGDIKDRLRFREHLEALHFDINTPRKDMK